MLHLKEIGDRAAGEKVTARDAKSLSELGGSRGRGAWFAGHGGIVPN